MESVIINKWASKITDVNPLLFKDISLPSKLHAYYNFLLFPHPEVHKLYFAIRELFNEIRVHDGQYYISMWYNIHRKTEHMGWHTHNKPEHKAYHGYFSVNAEPSVTSYILSDQTTKIDVINKNNQLVLSRSDGDIHGVSLWNETKERLTIAFDIIPLQLARGSFDAEDRTNNWMPI
jgi:hypothetical protein